MKTVKKSPRCDKHPDESATACFSCYLDQPCDEPDCDRTADHNGIGKTILPCMVCAGCRFGYNCERPSGKHGKFCNEHCDFDKPAFARND